MADLNLVPGDLIQLTPAYRDSNASPTAWQKSIMRTLIPVSGVSLVVALGVPVPIFDKKQCCTRLLTSFGMIQDLPAGALDETVFEKVVAK